VTKSYLKDLSNLKKQITKNSGNQNTVDAIAATNINCSTDIERYLLFVLILAMFISTPNLPSSVYVQCQNI
jgi:hypothetical protein